MARESVYLHAAPMFHMADFAGSMGTILCCGSNVILQSFEAGSGAAGHRTGTDQPCPAGAVNDQDGAESPRGGGGRCIQPPVRDLWRIAYARCNPGELHAPAGPSVGLVQVYGQTELAPIATALSMEDHRAGSEKLRSAGRPTASSDIRIVDEQGR